MEKTKNVEIHNKYRELIEYISSLGTYTAISYQDDCVSIRVMDISHTDIFKFILSIPKDDNGYFQEGLICVSWRVPNYTHNIMTHNFKAGMDQRTMLGIIQFSILNWRLSQVK